MTYIPLKKINEAIGSPEADGFALVTQVSTGIISDKTVLVNALLSFGVPASLTDDLITLINKITPLSINYNQSFIDVFLDKTSVLTGNTDSFVTLLTTATEPTVPDESFVEPTYVDNVDAGNMWLGGDADNTTKSLHFVVTEVVDGTTLNVDRTTGFAFGDSLTQDIYTTSIVSVVSTTRLIVVDTTGWVASTFVSTF